MITIDNTENINPFRFNKEYFQAQKPLLIKDGARETKYFKKWSLDYLKSRFAERDVGVFNNESEYYNFNIKGEVIPLRRPFKQVIDYFTLKNHEATNYYMPECSIDEVFPELLEDLEIPQWNLPTDLVNLINLWVSGKGGVTPLQSDFSNNFLSQIAGRKEFTIFSPKDSPNLYSRRVGKTYFSQVDLSNVDRQRFPLFKKAHPIKFQVDPGDVLFIPSGWWHFVRSLDPGISVNYIWNRLELKHDVGMEYLPVQELTHDINRYLRAGLSINHKGVDGEYLMISAIRNGYANVIEALLSLGAEPNLLSEKYHPGKLALTIARDIGNIKIAKLLIQYGAGARRQKIINAPVYNASA